MIRDIVKVNEFMQIVHKDLKTNYKDMGKTVNLVVLKEPSPITVGSIEYINIDQDLFNVIVSGVVDECCIIDDDFIVEDSGFILVTNISVLSDIDEKYDLDLLVNYIIDNVAKNKSLCMLVNKTIVNYPTFSKFSKKEVSENYCLLYKSSINIKCNSYKNINIAIK